MMHLHEILRPELITVKLEAEKKREAMSELVDLLIQHHELPMKQRDVILEAFYEDEESLGSGMERGIAVPHLATDLVQDIICAVGIAPKGIPFRSLDGKLARIVVLLLVPKKDFEGEVQAIRGIQHLLEDRELVTALQSAVSPVEALKLIEAAEDGNEL
jgi:mannitol/fructose-specific phosphotransferase system IIA component (Ntr-type)